ncbi:cytochrome b2 [Colletotrichum abscissum]|uniref:Cytochrome b2 n=1 Tax=Colletotrichum abscissum TaxID=1671311 RepID=A0A9Q0B1V9_9PEZI|nr:[Colletotrichum abscissum] [Colletotrichum abscissum]KAI3549255.1 cytochrome b2 [Colletotrichum abscissum]KAK1507143.1 cytochrome b2 [Colletotrichum abscissum]
MALSCWIVINKIAYDVTQFVGSHPGGEAVLLSYAGRDATDAFVPLHPPGTLKDCLSAEQNLGPVTENEESSRGNSGVVCSDENLSTKRPSLSAIVNIADFEKAAETILSKQSYASPFFIAPAGGGKLANSEGEVLLTRAAARHGILQWVCNNAGCTMDQMAAARSGRQTLYWQIYAKSDLKKSERELRHALELGYTGFALTVDAVLPGLRERDVRNSLDDVAAKHNTSASMEEEEEGGGGERGSEFYYGTTIKRP